MVASQWMPENLDSVKNHVMNMTMKKMAYLAYYLGYGWCGGCNSLNVGEGFIRRGDTLEADTNCPEDQGYKSKQRLIMVYGDWHFSIRHIYLGMPSIEELTPEIVNSGVCTNFHDTESTETVTLTHSITRSISHTKTSDWKSAKELGISFPYLGFKFSYENSETTTNSDGKDESTTFQVSTSKTLPPHSAANWKLMVYKTRKTIPYMATVIVRFSTQFRGFLRYGDGYNGTNPNFHCKHRGSEERPTFNYRFGDSTTPFYTALKQQSEANCEPWMWTDMIQKYSHAQNLINSLCHEKNYIFVLRGEFQDVEGKKIDVTWENDYSVIRKKTKPAGF